MGKPSFWRHDAAVVGIGTMIVFIATVLVAVIAAGVLIETSGKLQSQSQATGAAATEEVSSNLLFRSVVGIRNTTAENVVVYLEPYIYSNAGAPNIDLTQLRVELLTGTNLALLNYSQDPTPTGGQYKAEAVRDADSSFTVAAPSVTEGDLIKLNLTANSNGATLSPRMDVRLSLVPESGTRSTVEFRTPSTYGSKTIIPLA